MRNDIPDTHDYSKKNVGQTLFLRLHDVVCSICGLLAVRYLLMCLLTFVQSVQDIRKYGSLGSPKSLLHYLIQNNFNDYLIFFVCIAVELLLYIILCRRANQKKKPLWGGSLYLLAMIGFHTLLVMHSHGFIPGHIPEFSGLLDTSIILYGEFARYTILTAFTYFVMYLLRIRKLGKRADV